MNLEEIARVEKITIRGTKEELVDRIAKKLRVKVIRKYYSGLAVKRRIGVFKHGLVPPHRIMDDEEVEKLKKKYGLKSLKQLPRILVTDPAAISIGAARGDVLEITRNSEITGESKYYRLVI